MNASCTRSARSWPSDGAAERAEASSPYLRRRRPADRPLSPSQQGVGVSSEPIRAPSLGPRFAAIGNRRAGARMKSLIIFDLDGTLAESKSSLDAEMATLLGRLLGIVDVAIISGGAWRQFEKQVLAFLPHDERLKRLSLLPPAAPNFIASTAHGRSSIPKISASRKKENHWRARSGGAPSRLQCGKALGRL